MAENYLELQIKINPEMADIVSEICFENLPCEGIVLAEETYKDLEMIATTEGTLKVFLTEKTDVEKFLKEQRELLKSRGFSDEELGSWEFTLTEKPNEDWSKKWKEKWDVTHVSDRITVVPDWIEYAPHREDEVIIRLEPGCAFGTGTHQTTQLCMKAIEKYMPKSAKMADIGTGSGILGITALKLGAKEVWGTDLDENAITAVGENLASNDISSDRFHVLQGNIIDDKSVQAWAGYEKYDIVVANILADVIIMLVKEIPVHLKKGGYFITSGIINLKEEAVRAAFAASEELEVVEITYQGEWLSVTARKK